MRDAAWEFFVRHLAQNPKMADTFSGVILVMQANGLYMLKVPKLVHDEALVPLEARSPVFATRWRDGSAATRCHKDTFAVCEKTRQVAETAVKAVKELDDAIRHGWREVNTEKLAVRVHGELESALLQPLATQCRQLEEMTSRPERCRRPMEESDTQTPRLSFQRHSCRMCVSCLVIMGGGFAYGWWKLSHHYDLSWWTPP